MTAHSHRARQPALLQHPSSSLQPLRFLEQKADPGNLPISPKGNRTTSSRLYSLSIAINRPCLSRLQSGSQTGARHTCTLWPTAQVAAHWGQRPCWFSSHSCTFSSLSQGRLQSQPEQRQLQMQQLPWAKMKIGCLTAAAPNSWPPQAAACTPARHLADRRGGDWRLCAGC